MKKNGKRITADLLAYLLAGVLYAVSVNCFTAPNMIAPGGVTGLATVVNYLTGLRIGVTMLALNIPLFVVGYLKLGRKFVAKTIVATIIVSLAVDVVGIFLPAYTGDKLLASIFSGLLTGAALALIFLRGATSGGTDIAAKVLQQRFPHLSMGRLVMLVDAVIIIIAAIVFKSVESSLYAVIVLFVSSWVIDSALYGARNGRILLVITSRGDAISKAITASMERGTTLLPAKGGYTNEEKEVLVCAVRRHEVAKARKLIYEIDDDAFIMVAEAGEIIGEGFNGIE